MEPGSGLGKSVQAEGTALARTDEGWGLESSLEPDK